MADILSRLLSFSPPSDGMRSSSPTEYDEQIRSLISYLRQMLANNVPQDTTSLLEALDPSVHSISYLLIFHFHVLSLQSATTKQAVPGDLLPGRQLWSKVILFLKAFDPIQVRYVGGEWRKAVDLVAKAAEAVHKARDDNPELTIRSGADIPKPILAIQPIRDAMLRLDPSGSIFTYNHVLLSRLCLRARAYAMALPVIDHNISYFPAVMDRTYYRRYQSVLCGQHIPTTAMITQFTGLSAKLAYRDHLQYFLYSSMIYIGLKRWRDALHFLNIVISAPSTNSVSLIMVEAYKKWILISLIEHGGLISLSNIVLPHIVKIYKALGRPYNALAEVFASGDIDKLRAEIEIGQSIWDMDNNTGLVSQALEAFRQRSILRLYDTFAALKIADIAHHKFPHFMNLEEFEPFVSSLILAGKLDATLLQSGNKSSSTTLRFSISAQTPGVRETLIQTQLIAQRRKLKSLISGLEENDKRLELSKEHVDNLRRNRKTESVFNDCPASGKGDGPDFEVDEDMMGDLQ